MINLRRRAFLEALTAAPLAGLAGGGFGLRADSPAIEKVYRELLAEHDRRLATFNRELVQLADECETNGLAADALEIRELAQPANEGSLKFDDLPATVLPEISRAFPEPERLARIRLRRLREDYSADLFKLSLRARQKQQVSLAWQCVREAAFHDSDNPRARALLGFVKVDDVWMTPFRRQMLSSGKVWHERFGWLKEKDVARYEHGERLFNGNWMSAEREASLRADFRNAWVAASEHFLVRTNHSLERAVELSVSLERFYQYFVRTFAAVFMSPQQLQQLFEGGLGGHPQPARPRRVDYYRDQQEFIDALRGKQPEAAFSNGIYLPTDRTSYFFHKANAEEVEETLYHETTHQILSESTPRIIAVGVDGGFWLVEGLACYLESFRPRPSGGDVGDRRHIRLMWAREFLVKDKFFVPIEAFTAMDQRQFQCMDLGNGPERFDRLQRYYAQAAGLTHFFLHFDDGAYRDALISYLSQLYSPDVRVRNHIESLAELTDVDFETLDRQYIEHMRQEP